MRTIRWVLVLIFEHKLRQEYCGAWYWDRLFRKSFHFKKKTTIISLSWRFVHYPHCLPLIKGLFWKWRTLRLEVELQNTLIVDVVIAYDQVFGGDFTLALESTWMDFYLGCGYCFAHILPLSWRWRCYLGAGKHFNGGFVLQDVPFRWRQNLQDLIFDFLQLPGGKIHERVRQWVWSEFLHNDIIETLLF